LLDRIRNLSSKYRLFFGTQASFCYPQRTFVSDSDKFTRQCLSDWQDKNRLIKKSFALRRHCSKTAEDCTMDDMPADVVNGATLESFIVKC